MKAATKGSALFIQDPKTRRETLLGPVSSEAVIGKSESAQLRLPDLRCESLHALIETDPETGRVNVTDLGTHFGTYYQGKRVHHATLELGDHFVIGRHRLVVRPSPERDTQTGSDEISAPPVDEMYREDQGAPLINLNQSEPVINRSARIRPVLDPDTTLLQVTLYWGDELLEQRTFNRGESVSIGTQADATFGLTFKDPRLNDAPYTIAQFQGGTLSLTVPSEATGLVWINSEARSLDDLRHEDKRSLSFGPLTLNLDLHDRADISLGGLSLSFRFIQPAEKLPQLVIPTVDRTFFKLGAAVIFLFVLFSAVLLSLDMPVKETTLEDVPSQLKRAVYDAGIAKALKRHKAAVGPLADNHQGGRASGKEGKLTSARAPQPQAKPMRAKKELTKRHLVQPVKNQKSRFTQASSKNQKSHRPTEVAPEVDINSAFIDSPKKLKSAPDVAIQGKRHSGNTVAAIIDEGNYSQGRRGRGEGGGGKSVGIGSLSGENTGGGMGAGDYGLTPSKGKEISDRESEELVILGGLDRDVIASVIRRYLAQIQHCYELQLAVNPKLKGKVTVGFMITGSGAVQRAEVVDTSLRNAATETCMVQRILSWKFPKPKGGGTVGVRYPFLLMSSSGS